MDFAHNSEVIAEDIFEVQKKLGALSANCLVLGAWLGEPIWVNADLANHLSNPLQLPTSAFPVLKHGLGRNMIFIVLAL